MSATYAQARNEILAQFIGAWNVTGYPCHYPDRPFTPPTDATPWARITVRHSGGGQGSLAGALGKVKWGRTGRVTVQIFTAPGTGLSTADDLAKLVANAFEGVATPRGVWFRNVHPVEVGPDGGWYQVNVLADFEYDEVK